MERDYSQSVQMMCSTCGGRNFSFDDENGPVCCVECGRVFSRDDLLRENGAVVEAAADDMEQQILKLAGKKLGSMLQKLK